MDSTGPSLTDTTLFGTSAQLPGFKLRPHAAHAAHAVQTVPAPICVGKWVLRFVRGGFLNVCNLWNGVVVWTQRSDLMMMVTSMRMIHSSEGNKREQNRENNKSTKTKQTQQTTWCCWKLDENKHSQQNIESNKPTTRLVCEAVQSARDVPLSSRAVRTCPCSPWKASQQGEVRVSLSNYVRLLNEKVWLGQARQVGESMITTKVVSVKNKGQRRPLATAKVVCASLWVQRQWGWVGARKNWMTNHRGK